MCGEVFGCCDFFCDSEAADDNLHCQAHQQCVLLILLRP
jgi:hypothetical protein